MKTFLRGTTELGSLQIRGHQSNQRQTQMSPFLYSDFLPSPSPNIKREPSTSRASQTGGISTKTFLRGMTRARLSCENLYAGRDRARISFDNGDISTRTILRGTTQLESLWIRATSVRKHFCEHHIAQIFLDKGNISTKTFLRTPQSSNLFR